MRVECERCQALVAGDFVLDAGTVSVTCAACGASLRAAVRTAAKITTPPVAVDGCRKCGAPATDGDACPRCGLARTRAVAWAAAEDAVDPALAAAWSATVARWDDAVSHDRVAGIALDHQALPWLTRRYREVQRERPNDAIARARVERIAAMTMAALKATAGAASAPRRSRATYLVLIVLAIVVAGALLAAKAASGKHPGKRRPAMPEDTSPSRRARPAIEPGVGGR